ncbi:hypothetical protein M427DRAFT_76091 [Gonapodya prolifera JEL478]|uniref:Coagulation factor 5/8 type domain-containing protein n=1 Tax=Gonapodya prolifera (strain JEL478) TaxID=1344416 RepID=A0A138ZXW6_GONPJ|nr:hypothetical protein M427DRAFT_76091 [Gonapodya prolifera JEL478]|eukprot:KXS08983.1 hypothetical protein M427DRAFT_76091 [Gonapodya prolifera JEL478]
MRALALLSPIAASLALLVGNALAAPLRDRSSAEPHHLHARAPISAPSDSLDGVCATFQLFSGDSNLGYLYRKGNGYQFTSDVTAATSFRLEATLLSRYEIFDSSGGHLFLSVITWIMPGADYGDRSDWKFALQPNGRYTIVSTSQGSQIGVFLGTLGGAGSGYSMALASASGCFTPPDVTTATSGVSTAGVSNGKIVGVIDMHAHIAAGNAFGGNMHCGDSWSPGGVTKALQANACPGYETTISIGTLLESIFSGRDIGQAKGDGWPTFNGWPTYQSVLHEQAYYRGIQRAYESGLRVLNALLVANRVICTLFPAKDLGSCDEMDQIRAQATYLTSMQDYIDAQSGGVGKGWFRIVTTPAELRAVVGQGKLAVTVGIEASEIFGCRVSNGNSMCSEADVDAGFDEVAKMGVSGFFPVHKFDNALGGTRMDPGATGAFINIGNLYSTGSWWDLVSCPNGPSDQPQPTSQSDLALVVAMGILALPTGTSAPNYPSGPVCNTRGLTKMGEYVVKKMMSRGWVVHVDHMSVKTANDTLNILINAGYPGVISEHSWSDYYIVNRVLQAGGVVSAIAFNSTDFVKEWRNYRNLPEGSKVTAFGYGSDINGFFTNAAPRTDATTDPLVYPFTSLAGTTVDRQVMGQRTFDLNTDGVAQYGQYADWMVDDVKKAGAEAALMKAHFLNSAEAYTSMWERARKWAGLQ